MYIAEIGNDCVQVFSKTTLQACVFATILIMVLFLSYHFGGHLLCVAMCSVYV